MPKKIVSLSGGCLQDMIIAQNEYGIKGGENSRKARELIPLPNGGRRREEKEEGGTLADF